MASTYIQVYLDKYISFEYNLWDFIYSHLVGGLMHTVVVNFLRCKLSCKKSFSYVIYLVQQG
jgi:hypothetical protein